MSPEHSSANPITINAMPRMFIFATAKTTFELNSSGSESGSEYHPSAASSKLLSGARDAPHSEPSQTLSPNAPQIANGAALRILLDGEDHARGRPVGLALDKSGALLIADDVGNTVWRVTSADQQVTQRQ
jgi:hypothetical protein